MFRPSKCDLKEETGFYSTHVVSTAFRSRTEGPYDRCAIGVFVIPSIHGLLIAIACVDELRATA